MTSKTYLGSEEGRKEVKKGSDGREEVKERRKAVKERRKAVKEGKG